ncbi:tyrosine-type recombinase/integrase [Tardiphaga robiniae]|uniref:Integrase n=1 Tax=Tardiphaga robiniae TaxID=943830 RepID=A0A120MG55_9BRAD|nr:integrase arm-type DNA-binding domain-containing protein [Tardiphaga robiniae]AMH39547.1 putative prophage CPS-53 integrase [Tardiphaga robiniae]KZD25513.1 integrase [Tardiphaga robiniae]
MTKLTKRTVDAIKPTEGELVLWDDELPGFGLRAKSSGAKSFIVQYRNANGRSRRLTVGRYGVLTVEEARKAAKLALAEVVKGSDPAESRKLARGAMTIEELAAEYMDEAEKGLILTRTGKAKSESTIYTDKGRVARHIVPLIGKRTVKDFTTSDAGRFQRDVIAGKSAADVKTKLRGRAIVTGGKGTASRTMGLLGGIFSYAVGEGYRPDNPIHGIVRPKDSTREWRLDDDGYRRLGNCLAIAEANGEHWQPIMASKAAALTGCRLDEIEGLLKTQVDAVGMALRLGDTKTGKSIRPVGSAVIALLKAASVKSKSKFVFPAITSESKHHTGLTRWLQKVSAKDVPGITCHGLRHSFSSTAEDLGFSLPTIKALVGHARSSVTEGYIHKIDSALVAAADRIARHIDNSMTGRKDSEVIQLRTA